MLQTLDRSWREHLAALDHLRQGIHLRGYAQKNPKQEYKREAFELFAAMLDAVKHEVTRVVMNVQIQSPEQLGRGRRAVRRASAATSRTSSSSHAEFAEAAAAAPAAAEAATAAMIGEAMSHGSSHAGRAGRERRTTCRRSAATIRARAAAARSTSSVTARLHNGESGAL